MESMLKKYPVVAVEWVDSSCTNPTEGYFVDEVSGAKTLIMFNSGFLVSENKESITLASNISEQEIHRILFTIPKVCIVKVYKTKWVKS